MAYDEPTFRRSSDGSGYRDEPGFREEPDFRDSSGPYQAGGYPMNDYPDSPAETTLTTGRRGAVSTATLGNVFDDPEHGDPGRDRLGVHVGWELVLLLAVGTVGFLLWREHPAEFKGSGLRALLVSIAALGLVTLGAGLSLRVAAANLAVGPVAAAAMLFFAKEGDQGVVTTTGVIVLFAMLVGAAIALLVVAFHVPGWAASLGAALVAVVWIERHSGVVPVSGGYAPNRHAYYLAGGFVALAVLAGLFGTIKPIRRAVGRFRPVADPARRRGGAAAALTAAAIVGSTILAAVGGVLLAANQAQVLPTQGLEYTGLALGTALLGGTSAFGRRGGIFGTTFAVILVVLFLAFDRLEGWRISWYAVGAALIAAGLMVTRLVEALGRPRVSRDDDEDSGEAWVTSTGTTQPVGGSGWSSSARQDSWSSSLPAQQSTTHTADLWSEDRWGSRSSR